MRKCATLLAVFMLATSCLIMAKPTWVQAVPQPSVPDFTLKYVEGNSYDAPPTYGVDPYTGKTVLLSPGYHVENSFVEITIKSQNFTPYRDADSHFVDLYFNVSYKGHYDEDWEYHNNNSHFIRQSNSEFTVVKHVPSADQMDFRVQARIGYYNEYRTPYLHYEFTGQTSGWSNTQTITISKSNSTLSSSEPSPTATSSALPTSNPTATPMPLAVGAGVLFGLGWQKIAIIALGFAVVGLVAVMVFQRRRSVRSSLQLQENTK